MYLINKYETLKMNQIWALIEHTAYKKKTMSSLLINLSAQRPNLDIDLSHTKIHPKNEPFVGETKGKMVATSFLSYETDQQQIDKHGL